MTVLLVVLGLIVLYVAIRGAWLGGRWQGFCRGYCEASAEHVEDPRLPHADARSARNAYDAVYYPKEAESDA